MPQMCQRPGCPHLACVQASIEDVTVSLCLHCGRKAAANREWIEARLRQHEHGASCPHCARPATIQYHLGGDWHIACEPCGKRIVENVHILRGVGLGDPRAVPVKPLRPYYAKAPQVRIEEDPTP